MDPVQNVSKAEIRKTVRGMKSGKAAGCSGVVIEMIKTLGVTGIGETVSSKVFGKRKLCQTTGKQTL